MPMQSESILEKPLSLRNQRAPDFGLYGRFVRLLGKKLQKKSLTK